MKITSRSRLSLASAYSVTAERKPEPPGPPVSISNGSGFGLGLLDFSRVTGMEICFPSGFTRFSGTVNRPQVYSGPSLSSGRPFHTGSGHGLSA